MKVMLILWLLISVLAITADAQQPPTEGSSAPLRAEVLVLGTYHMGNPGHDIGNIQADDVLLPKRQREIAQLIEVLKKFHPTKIAVEASVGSQRITREYAEYLVGKYQLSRNEIDQIGYRLAKELGHKTIYPVDVDADFPWQHVVNYAKANGLADKVEALLASTRESAKEDTEFLESHTIVEMLGRLNSDTTVASSLGWYYACMRLGYPNDYAGPDLLTAWYQRNIRIYNNIVTLIESPSDRILVIYGYGHLGLLRQNVANDPAVSLRKLAEFNR